MKYLLVFLLVLFASYADIFLFRVGIVPFTPSNFLVPLFIVVAFLRYSVKDYYDIVKMPSFRFLTFLLVISILYAAVSKAETSILITTISLEVFSILLYLFAVQFFRTQKKKFLLVFAAISFIVLAGSVWYDFFIGLPNYNAYLAQSARKGGFGENPNQAASGIKFIALGILLLVNKSKTLKYSVILLTVMSIFLTFSRSGTVSLIIILILGTMNNWRPNFQLTAFGQFKSMVQIFVLFSVLYMVLLSLADVIKSEFPAFTRGTAGQRMELLLGKSDQVVFESDDNSELSRTGLFKSYLYKFFDNPLGMGTGYSSDKSFNRLKTHNYYLYMAVDFGIIGIAVYLFYLTTIIRTAVKENQYYYFIFGILLVVEGLISHSIFIERSLLISLAFFDAQLLLNKKNTAIEKQ